MPDPEFVGQGVQAPHTIEPIDPVWDQAVDVTEALKGADPECTVFAWGMPRFLPHADEPRVRWVQVVVCAEFDVPEDDPDPHPCPERRATEWRYQGYIIDDADHMEHMTHEETYDQFLPHLRDLLRRLQGPGRRRQLVRGLLG